MDYSADAEQPARAELPAPLSEATTTPVALPSESKSPKPVAYSADFERAWQILPARQGSNPKGDAYSAWKARLREGYAPTDLILGAERYAAFIQAEGSAGSRFVMRGATFFGRANGEPPFTQDWRATPPTIPKLSEKGRRTAENARRILERDGLIPPQTH